MTKNERQGSVIGFKIETDNPERNPNFLAIQLADALQAEMNAKQDAMEYRSQAQRERQKAKQMINTLTMLQEYKKGIKNRLMTDPEWETKPPYEGGPSRMDPMRSYDEKDLKEQKVEAIQRAKQFDEIANHYDHIARQARQLQEKLQREIRTGNGGKTSRWEPINKE